MPPWGRPGGPERELRPRDARTRPVLAWRGWAGWHPGGIELLPVSWVSGVLRYVTKDKGRTGARVIRLCPDHRNPEQFHEDKSEIAAELRLARLMGMTPL